MKKCLAWLAAVLCLTTLQTACAETLVIPPGMLRIEDESFCGCEALRDVVISEGTVSLGDRAFYGCTGLREVTVPASVTGMGTDCFAGCSEALLVNCAPDSEALEYARSNGFDYDAGTVCRAVVVGQSYADTRYELVGPLNDVPAVKAMLETQKTRRFNVNCRIDLTAAELLESVENTFAEATDRDISLFYYSGHGDEQGELIGTDFQYVAPADLRAVLDEVPGRKIVIIDACYSGNWVTDAASRSAEADPAAFTQAFLQGFLGKARSTAAQGEYYVIASAGADEECWEKNFTSGGKTKNMGCFTHSFCIGCGWNGVAECAVEPAADANGDGAVSIAEAFEYAEKQTRAMYMGQQAQTNAADCFGFAPFR